MPKKESKSYTFDIDSKEGQSIQQKAKLYNVPIDEALRMHVRSKYMPDTSIVGFDQSLISYLDPDLPRIYAKYGSGGGTWQFIYSEDYPFIKEAEKKKLARDTAEADFTKKHGAAGVESYDFGPGRRPKKRTTPFTITQETKEKIARASVKKVEESDDT